MGRRRNISEILGIDTNIIINFFLHYMSFYIVHCMFFLKSGPIPQTSMSSLCTHQATYHCFFFMELTQILISIFLYYMSFYMVHCTQISISLCILHATYHCICKGKRKYTYIKKKTKNVFPQFFIVVCKKSVLILIKDFNIW